MATAARTAAQSAHPETSAAVTSVERRSLLASASSSWDPPTSLLASLSVAALILASFVVTSEWDASTSASSDDSSPRSSQWHEMRTADEPGDRSDRRELSALSCPVSSLDDLHPLERSPRAYSLSHPEYPRRHAIPPPSNVGGFTSLVCCRTTAGPLAVAVHTNWAPNGASRFLNMVKSGYFEAAAPFHRCSEGGGFKSGEWCEFSAGGRTGRRWRESEIDDDDNWLWDGVGGAEHTRSTKGRWAKGKADDVHDGMKRIPRGSLAFAPPSVAGVNRTHHLVLAMSDVDAIRTSTTPTGEAAGYRMRHMSWEVPFGELVHPSSYQTLERLFMGYGENGPSDRDVMASGGGLDSDIVNTFPNMDYVLGCEVVVEESVGTD